MQQRGSRFTLVEMLVVIGILAVLASLLMPAMSNALRNVKQAQCANNLKGIGGALVLYHDDYGYLPAVERTGAPWWWSGIHPYLADGKASTGAFPTLALLRCQIQADKMASLFGNPWFSTAPSYGMNGFIGPSWGAKYYKLTQFRYPTTTFAVSECGFTPGSMQVSTNSDRLISSAYENGASSSGGTYAGGVHSGANNMLWLDGHLNVWYDVITTGSPPYSRYGAEDIWCRGL